MNRICKLIGQSLWGLIVILVVGCGTAKDLQPNVRNTANINDQKDLYLKLYTDKELRQLSALKVLPPDLPDGFIIGFVNNLNPNWEAPNNGQPFNTDFTDGNALSKKFDLLPQVNTQYKRLAAYLCQKYGLEVLGQCFITEDNFMWVKLQSQNKIEPAIVMKTILANEQAYVTCINHNWIKKITTIPNDPWLSYDKFTTFPFQWYIHYAQINKIWEIETGKNSVTVAILDTGVRRTHNDLNDGRVMTFPPGVNADIVNGDNDPNDEDTWANGHGTGCAGIVGQIANNAYLGTGVAQSVTIMPVRCMASNGAGNDYWTSSAINFAVAQKAHIISMSLGGEGSSYILENACNNANKKGIFVCAAAGNSYYDQYNNYYNPIEYPAAYTSVMGVGAAEIKNYKSMDLEQTWTRCSFCNDHPYVEIVTAGNYIPVLNRLSDDGSYAAVAGTSQACPIIAGVAALLKSFRPDFTNTQIRDIIRTKSSLVSGFDNAPDVRRLDGKKIADYLQTLLSFPDIFFSSPKKNSIVTDGKSFNVSLLNSETLSKVDYYLDGKFIISLTQPPFSTSIGTNKIGNKRAVLEAWCYISGLSEPKIFTTTIDIVNLYGDTNGDNVVDYKDLEPIINNYGKQEGDTDYRGFIDANLDQIIDERDLTVVGQFYGREL